MAFDDRIACEEVYDDDHLNICPNCGTDHTDPGDEWMCLEGQAEPYDLEHDDRNPYDGTYEWDDYDITPDDWDM